MNVQYSSVQGLARFQQASSWNSPAPRSIFDNVEYTSERAGDL